MTLYRTYCGLSPQRRNLLDMVNGEPGLGPRMAMDLLAYFANEDRHFLAGLTAAHRQHLDELVILSHADL